MKRARKVILIIGLLVLLYAGAYTFFRSDIIDAYIWREDSKLSGSERRLRKFFAPAFEIDLRLTFDRPARKHLRGHWIAAEPGDFVTISEKDGCSFRLGEFEYSGKAVLDRTVGGYRMEFPHGGTPSYFIFTGNRGDWGTTRARALTYANIGSRSEPVEFLHHAELTLSSPAPAP